MDFKNLYAVDDAVRAAMYGEAALYVVGQDDRVKAALHAWIGPSSPTDVRDVIAQLMANDLRLPYVWLAEWLAMLFLWNDRTGSPVPFEVKVVGLPKRVHRVGRKLLAELRKPKRGQIEQDVAYWYRCRVAQQRQTPDALGRELRKSQREPRATTGRNTITAAIRRTELALHSIDNGGLGDPYIRLNILASGKITTTYFDASK